MAKTFRFKIRQMLYRDLSQVLAIEKKCFVEAYTTEIFRQELKIKAAILWVATYRGKVIGYMDFWMVANEVELVSIAVDSSFSGRGVAQGMMEKMIEYAVLHGTQNILLDVRRSNQKARSLYASFGFQKAGLRKRYYSDNQEDAIIMKRTL